MSVATLSTSTTTGMNAPAAMNASSGSATHNPSGASGVSSGSSSGSGSVVSPSVGGSSGSLLSGSIRAVFVILAKNDAPIYQRYIFASFVHGGRSAGSGGEGAGGKVQKEDLLQFILHAALDSVEQKVWTTQTMYLKQVDKFNDTFVSAFVTAGHVRFLLLHDSRLDENTIKSFFLEAYELYVKVLMNPFYIKHAPIISKDFDHRVKLLGDKFLQR